jgi:hypothetical protein
MNPANQKKLFRAFAKQLQNGIPPSEAQTKYLIHIFRGIADGEDPKKILGLTYDSGYSEQDERAKVIMDLVMHIISCEINPINEYGEPQKPLSLTKAFEKGSILAKRFFNKTDSDSYDPAYIKKKWYEHKKQGRESIYRTAISPDSIYEYTVTNPKK